MAVSLAWAWPSATPAVYSQTAFAGAGGSITTPGQCSWTDEDKICVAGSASALCFPFGPGCITGYLIGTQFGFNIPANATIVGVEAEIYWYDSYFAGDHGIQNVIKLHYNGLPVGNNQSTYAEIPVPMTVPLTTVYSDEDEAHWGTTLTPAVVNSPTFGFCFQAHHVDTGDPNDSIDIDAFKMTVYYSL
jgi:hypothetical protein